MTTRPNTYNTHNSKGKTQYKDSNDIFYNIVDIDKTTEFYSAFTLNLDKHPSHILNLNSLNMLSDIDLYNKYDVAEVIRGDYSRLFFDIDCHDREEFDSSFAQSMKVVKDIVDIISKETQLMPENIISGFFETKETDPSFIPLLINILNNTYINGSNGLALYTKQQKAKYVSAHIYLRGVYFTRAAIKKLFQHFNSKVKRMNSTLPDCLDCTIYVEGQRIFRHPFSGKAIQARGPPLLTKEAGEFLRMRPDAFIATKTDLDNILISEYSNCYSLLTEYLKSYIISDITIASKKEAKEFAETLDEELKPGTNIFKDIKRFVACHTPQSEWYFNLIKKIQFYIYKHPGITDEKIILHFSKDEFLYVTQTHKRHVLNISAINSAIKVARANPLTTSKIIKEIKDLPHILPEDMTDLMELKSIVGDFYGVDMMTLAKLIHSTFIFFTRVDDDKESINFIAFKINNTLVVKSYVAFLSYLKTTPIPIRLNKQGVIYKLEITQAFNIYDCLKSKYYDFELCSENENVLSLYCNPNPKPSKPVPLPECVSKIFDLYAEVEDKNNQESITYVVSEERKNFLLDWFAWSIQHPENRNKTCLQISAKQGIGKNIITNTLCKAIGYNYSLDNANIDNIIGTYNGGIDKKLLIVMNEVDTSAKNIDKLKSTITDIRIQINEKYGASYMGKNSANYVMFTNHMDTRTISDGDRRFVYIRTNANPYPKSFYDECVNPLTSCLKDEYATQFIQHLLTRDLTNYNPSMAPEFDKALLYENRKDKRSALYRLIDYIFTEKSPKLVKDVLIIDDLIEQLKNFRSCGISICDYYNIPSHKIEIENDLNVELNKAEFSCAGITKIINFNDEDKYIIKRCKKNFARDRQIILLK